jgi:MFS-type transporter involved in bile tolerance (Atg22 family)
VNLMASQVGGAIAPQVGGLLGSVLYGYIVDRTGSYDAPFIPITVLLLIGAALWANVDASRELGDRPDEAR